MEVNLMKYFDGEGCGASLAESEVLTEVVALKVTVFTFSYSCWNSFIIQISHVMVEFEFSSPFEIYFEKT